MDRILGIFFVVMDSPHVVALVPFPWESISIFRTITSREFAQKGVNSVAVESMGFPLMAKQAGS
jgi:hypothetical protein